jgi:ABC-type multidrug transport system fused ATPase/permease subunit
MVQVYVMQLFTPLNFLGTIYNMVINGLVDLEKLSKILNLAPDVVDAPKAAPLRLPAATALAGGSRGTLSSKPSDSNQAFGVSVEFRDVW